MLTIHNWKGYVMANCENTSCCAKSSSIEPVHILSAEQNGVLIVRIDQMDCPTD